MPRKTHYASDFKPDFGIPWVPVLPRSMTDAWPLDKLQRYQEARAYAEKQAELNPVGGGWILPSWKDVMDTWDKYQVHVVCGGNRCLRGDTLIYDPVLGLERRIDEIKGPHHVLAFNTESLVIAEAEEPFTKGSGPMRRVTLSTGASFVAALEHRVLGLQKNPIGAVAWRQISDLVVGDLMYVPSDEPAPEIVEIADAGVEVKWDMTVPFHENYLAAGVIHHNSSKSTLASRLAVWAACTIPEAEVRCYHVSEERSIEQQRFIWEAIPLSIKNLPTKKGTNHSITYSQKNGFTDNICIFPPLPGYRRGGYIKFGNYKQYQQDAQIAEGFKAHFTWCIAGGELVAMADGTMRPIEAVKVGDSVLSIDLIGRPTARKVLATQYNGEKQCIRVKPRVGTPVICTPDHDLYWGYARGSKEEAAKATRMAQLLPGWWPEKTKDRSDAWYIWAGLVVSEGTVDDQKITSGWTEVIEKAIKTLPKKASVRKFTFSGKHSNHVPDWFLTWDEFWKGWPSVRSHTQEIPDWVFTSSPEKVRLFLRWLYHGDGWASGHTIGYATTSYKLANQTFVLLNRLGIRASFTIRKSKVENWRDQYWVMVSRASEVFKFTSEIGIEGKDEAVSKVQAEAERRIESKINRSAHLRTNGGGAKWAARNRRDKEKTSRIVLKEDAGLRPVYDITVEGEHRFLVGTSMVSNCDEEAPQKFFDTMMYRLIDYKGRMMLTFTTLSGWTPLVQDIMGRTKTIKKRRGTLIDRELPILQESLTRASTAIHYFWTEDNAFIDTSDFMSTMKSRSKDEVLARAYGVPTKSIAGVFPSFREDLNVIKRDALPWVKNPLYKVTRYMAIDPGGSKNWAMCWVAVDAAGTWWVYREWPDESYGEWALPGSTAEGKPGPAQKGSGKGIRDYVDLIRNLEDEEEVYERFIDPRMGAAERQTLEGATTIISELDEADVVVRPAPGVEIEHGIQLINNLLSWDETKPLGATNSPKFYVTDDCKNLIFSLKEYTAKGGSNEACKDFIDLLRYLATSNIDFVDTNFVDKSNRTGCY